VKHSKFLAALGASGLAAGLALSAPASAHTAWSVSISGPGYAVAAAAPVYYGHRHWHRAYLAPVVYAAPVVYSAPVVVTPPVVYSAPVVYAPRVIYRSPRVVYRHW